MPYLRIRISPILIRVSISVLHSRRLHLSNIATRDLGTKVRERQAVIYRFTIFQSEALQHPPLVYYVVIHCASAPLSSTWQRYRLPSFLCIQIISESTVIQYNMHCDDVAVFCLTSCVFPFFSIMNVSFACKSDGQLQRQLSR
jgi:hypothetical protein